MIRPGDIHEEPDTEAGEPPFRIVLGRYGLVPQVARFAVSRELWESAGDQLSRNSSVVAQTDRGPEVATVLEVIRQELTDKHPDVTGPLLRLATEADLNSQHEARKKCELDFYDWQSRLNNWQLQLQLIDIEQTLDDQQIILYVLNGQDAETTRLALLAAAAGLGIIHVQPVSAEGIVQKTSGGGCGSGGCGSGGCST